MSDSFDALASEIENLATDVDDVVHDSAKDELQVVEGKALAEVPEAFGTLAASIRIRDDRALNQLQLVAGVPGIAEYPAFVEYGTGKYFGTKNPTNLPKTRYDSPGGVSTDFAQNIQRWIDAKGIGGILYDASPTKSGKPSDLAWAIARTIAKYGTKPHPFFRPAWRGHDRSMPRNVASSLNRRVKYLEQKF